ncbi:apoptosis regulatory protein Siva isoform X2 [Thalassophryne amazonica]|uniref:apoptosis regulatory protein Siva isoform X2 n=1 Tax=Thalassophryne amazonica TaxID=390379 RepID=UPI001470F25F|nr:apoptosis regulatory protein Siva isoform X2 [Thalassophryne amazonica]
MPKRGCPFTETFSSQYKIHVGQQELSHNSVLGNKYRQEIYEKTKNLLFNGSKTVTGKIWNGEDKSAVSPACSTSLLKGQTLIGQDGRLTRAGTASGVAMAPGSCCVCQKNQRSRALCSQCDRHTCATCTRQCSSCANVCCSVCTVIDRSIRPGFSRLTRS